MEIQELRNQSLDTLQGVIQERSSEKSLDFILDKEDRIGDYEYYVGFIYNSIVYNLKRFEHTLCVSIAQSDVDNETFFEHASNHSRETALELFYMKGAHTFATHVEKYKGIYKPYWDLLQFRNVASTDQLLDSMDKVESMAVEEHEDRWDKAEEIMFSY